MASSIVSPTIARSSFPGRKLPARRLRKVDFAKLLDLAEPAADEEQEQIEEQRDRAYWERKANPASLGIMDKLISLVPAGTRKPRVTYNQGHVAMGRSGRNFCWFHPRQKAPHNLVDLRVGEENRDEWISRMEDAGVSAYKTNAPQTIRSRLTERELADNEALLREVLASCEEQAKK